VTTVLPDNRFEKDAANSAASLKRNDRHRATPAHTHKEMP
jgi:hypothetical protein